MFKKKPTNHTNPHKQIYICDSSCNLWEKKKSSYVLLLFCLQNKTQKKRRSEKRLSKKAGWMMGIEPTTLRTTI